MGRAGKEGALGCPGAALSVPGWEKGLEQSRAGKKVSWPHSFTHWYKYYVAEELGLDPGLSLAKWMAFGK